MIPPADRHEQPSTQERRAMIEARLLAQVVLNAACGHIPPKPTFTSKQEWWTPEKAEKILKEIDEKSSSDKDTHLQRRYNHNWGTRYAKDMSDGRFLPTHQGIAFDEDGNLVDGRHRLAAIVISGHGQWILTTRGLPRKHLLAVDDGYKRADSAAMVIAGLHWSTPRATAVARRMSVGPSSATPGTRTKASIRAFMVKNEDAICFACNLGASKFRCLSAPVLAVLARAFYHEDKERLARFAEIMRTGEQDGRKDQAAIPFRNWMLRAENVGAGSTAQCEVYRKAQRSLRAFCDGAALNKIYADPDDLFPLPKGKEPDPFIDEKQRTVADLLPSSLRDMVRSAFSDPGLELTTNDLCRSLKDFKVTGKTGLRSRISAELISLMRKDELVRTGPATYKRK